MDAYLLSAASATRGRPTPFELACRCVRVSHCPISFGKPSAKLRQRVGTRDAAKVCGIDAAQILLDIAKARSPGADLRLGDLEELPFGDDQFDLFMGFNAFQYAGNPVRALGEAKRVAKPGASVVIVTWGPPEGMQAASLVAALRPVLPPPQPGAPGPFALSDEATLRAFAAQAGLVPGEMFDVESPWHYANLDDGLRGLKSAGVGVRAIEHSGEAKVDDAHRQVLSPFAQADGSYRIAATFRCLMTRA